MKLLLKIYKWVYGSFPYNKIRIAALRLSGVKVGEHVYLGESLLVITDTKTPNIKLELGDHPTTIYNGSNGNVNNSFTMNDNLPNVTNKKAKVISNMKTWANNSTISKQYL